MSVTNRGGQDPNYHTGNVHNIPLSDPRLKAAGIDPNSLLGKGMSERQFQTVLHNKEASRREAARVNMIRAREAKVAKAKKAEEAKAAVDAEAKEKVKA